ncbi:MAG TPA: lysophospholipid acyltransferase family protein [Thermoanaerobaculia bacterium]|jgi:1-acyl-sn-glycerol-3-phosphate acyltransferase|nr:lysophospholipid acyltransferase family protein [Thermoanaerobaculia bacterium]
MDGEKGPERAQARREGNGDSPEVSPLLLSMFGRYCENYLSRNFHAVRLSKSQRPDPVAVRGKPLVVYFNHPSWWDPLICIQLAAQLFPERRHYGPIDAAALGKYRFFEKLGFFGVEPGTARGARRFLTVSQEILSRPDTALWIAAEGRFTDPRERPVCLRSGIGHLASRVRQAVLLPLAIEYPFWEERYPEALARFGEEVSTGDADLGAGDWTPILESHLESALEALATESLSREPSRFEVLLGGGKAGAGGVYDTWRRLKARFTGERFRPGP